ncbi:MAG: hypothetical protein AAGD11_16555 [Planctomycetota bacterium]
MKPNSQQLERIVAYLDGELSPEESAQVEQLLASDAQFRRELQGAQRAWSALDQLPMAQVGDEFSRTTMEMVVDAATLDVEAKTIAMPVQRRKRKTTNILLIATTLLLGALAARIITQNPNRKLMADLPVIHNVDIYSQFENVDFLRELQANLGDQVDSYRLDEQQLESDLNDAKVIADSSNRKQWVQSLTSDQEITLRGKFNRFYELPGKKQDALRALHADLETDADHDGLLHTMYVYQQWLNELEPSEQYQLRELSPTERALQAAEEIERDASDHAFELSSEELRNLFEKVQPFVQGVINNHEREFQRTISRRTRQDRSRFESLTNRKQSTQRFIHAMRSSPESFREFIDTVSDALPAKMRDDFWLLPPGQRQEIIFGWFRQYHALNSGANRSGKVTEQELADFFVEVLDAEEKERLLALPRDEMQRQLRRMYLFKMPQHGVGPPGFRDGGPPSLGDGPPGGRRPRDRRDGDWRDRQGPPRGDRAGPPRPNGVPGRQEGNLDRRRGRSLREDDDREWGARQGPPRRRRPEGPPPRDDSPPDEPPSEKKPPARDDQ